mmetsp:Transcript_7374/g.18156  ORF Transcript_7374/g.18156 Transcript_7374/m.18156 type:complete len:163 (+) Transcript_7374:55-543(+)
MAKGARSNAHKHKRTKRRERAEAHYDKLLDERAEIARKHLENAQPVRDDEAKVAQQRASREEKKEVVRGRKREKKNAMKWEAMKPVAPKAMDTEDGSDDGAMTMDLDDAIRSTRSAGRRGRSKAELARKMQGGKLLGTRVKTTKLSRKNKVKKLKRKKQQSR